MNHGETTHRLFFSDSSELSEIEDCSVDLVVTSPPYPMVEMWDSLFAKFDPEVTSLIADGKGPAAFEKMHRILDRAWKGIYRVLKDGGIACINIGDAARSINGAFRLYSSHSRILEFCLRTGFAALPGIIWKKPTNAPNKFMGSGMLPAGAYVTLEHENILILRKGGKRVFNTPGEKALRKQSAIFWEERNAWFSDVWSSFRGIRQEITGSVSRKRSGAFPFELAYRLINMYSVVNDTVLDPFLGTGTTVHAAMASMRNSIGYEISEDFSSTIDRRIESSEILLNSILKERLQAHAAFIEKYEGSGKMAGHFNSALGLPVVTSQEEDIEFREVRSIERTANTYSVSYGDTVKFPPVRT